MLKYRFALWALGLALPEVSVLKPIVHRGIRSIALMVFAGIMLAVIITGGLAILYMYLTTAGLDTHAAAWVVLGIAALLALIAWMLAIRQIRALTTIPDALRPFNHPAPDMLGDAVQLIASGFLEGLLKPDFSAERRRFHKEDNE